MRAELSALPARAQSKGSVCCTVYSNEENRTADIRRRFLLVQQDARSLGLRFSLRPQDKQFEFPQAPIAGSLLLERLADPHCVHHGTLLVHSADHVDSLRRIRNH